MPFFKSTPTPEPDDWEAFFTKPTKPRSDWEMMKWVLFEPTLLDNYSNQLSKKEGRVQFLRMYVKYILPLSIICFLLSNFITSYFDLPALYPTEFGTKTTDVWRGLTTFEDKFEFLTYKRIVILLVSLLIGLLIGLLTGVFDSVLAGLLTTLLLVSFVSLFEGLFFGFFGGFFGGFFLGWILALSVGGVRSFFDDLLNYPSRGLFRGLVLGLVFSLVSGLVLGLILALRIGWLGGLLFGFGNFLGIILGWYLVQLRLWSYPLYFVSNLFSKNNFHKNPYLNDERIWLPLPNLKKQLLDLSQKQPLTAKYFVDFLFRYRPLQRGLAFEIEHQLTASKWLTTQKLDSFIFEEKNFLKIEEPRLKPIWMKLLVFDATTNDTQYAPSIIWAENYKTVRQTLVSIEQTPNLNLRQELLDQCESQIEAFRSTHYREDFIGKDFYFDVFPHWQKLIQQEKERLAAEAESIQKVSVNPYSKGTALSPDRRNKALFLERDDIKDAVSLKIFTSESMPTFLVLGQRRTGKTSLLNFLPPLLGARFDVVTVDMQEMSGVDSPVALLARLRNKISLQIIGNDATKDAMPTDWLEAWTVFENFLKNLSLKAERKLIIALDEYEHFHAILHREPERGGHFLSRMRAFSQSQNRIVFMFIGASNFSDLIEPQWSRYFVHAHTFRVDYLSRTATLQLITAPTPDFKLHYGTGVAEYLWAQTQGHPHLIHAICSDLVDYANAKSKNPIETADVDYILDRQIVLRGEQPFSVFWDEFCESPTMQAAVKAIAKGQTVDADARDVRRLEDYGYIVKDRAGGYQMRVPLFGRWVRDFGY